MTLGSTLALGRNTDIKYDKSVGLNVWHTSPDSFRSFEQKSGRTGRQGSPGIVRVYFNKEELGGKSVEALQAEIDENAAQLREREEVLYDLIGFLFTQFDALPETAFKGKPKADFLIQEWSKFNAKTELAFSEIRLQVNQESVREKFIKEVIDDFNTLMKSFTQRDFVEETVEHYKQSISNFEQLPQQSSDLKDVQVSDCVSPAVMAYHVVNYQTESKVEIQALKAKLQALFLSIDAGKFDAANHEYVQFLLTSKVTREQTVQVHKEMIHSYLSLPHQEKGLLQRLIDWIRGVKDPLSKCIDNKAYLIMFHTFAVLGATPEIKNVKNVVVKLLDDYLDSAWFVSSQRKNWAKDLKTQIASAKDIGEVIGHINQLRSLIVKSDLSNQNRLKPLHFFGKSRLQDTLNKAADLASSLAEKPILTEPAKEARQQYKPDKYNEPVLQSMERTDEDIQSRNEPEGMKGRRR